MLVDEIEEVNKIIEKAQDSIDKQADTHITMEKTLTNRIDDKVSSKMFRWILGIIIALMLSIGASTMDIKIDVIIMKKDLKQTENKLEPTT